MPEPTATSPLPRQGQDLIYALDIGTRSVIGMLGRREDGRVRILAMEKLLHAHRVMMDGQIEDIAQVAAAVRTVTDRLEQDAGCRLERACVAAAGRALLFQGDRVGLRPGEIGSLHQGRGDRTGGLLPLDAQHERLCRVGGAADRRGLTGRGGKIRGAARLCIGADLALIVRLQGLGICLGGAGAVGKARINIGDGLAVLAHRLLELEPFVQRDQRVQGGKAVFTHNINLRRFLLFRTAAGRQQRCQQQRCRFCHTFHGTFTSSSYPILIWSPS